jgi:type IV secretion system protein VirB7
MRKLILIAVLGLGLAGCSTLSKDKPPICDGKHRRPANPYGSVLDPTTPPATSPAAADSAPDKVSALSPSYARCRG